MKHIGSDLNCNANGKCNILVFNLNKGLPGSMVQPQLVELCSPDSSVDTILLFDTLKYWLTVLYGHNNLFEYNIAHY